ncbi:phage tail assembly protein [Serratia fonticola]|uniref:phage tail assembly protein n=1 Tax=Serratia fonticola TaxID=47917 RepID=UPI001AE20CF3|nr:phage tail assembly protein [Serratia fonticola]MBP0996651.1 phage tail assembly protein [Serratia fonticola]
MFEKSKTIQLSKNLEMADGTIYESLDLKEPVLGQVEQFYECQRNKNSMAAMKLLISLVSSVPEKVLGTMDFTDYKKCEDFLMGFLTYKSSTGGSD